MITERVLAHRRRIIAEMREEERDGFHYSSDLFVQRLGDDFTNTLYLPKDMTERDWIAYQALLASAVHTCDDVECNPAQTAARALEAVRPYLPETLTGYEIERTTA